jgi:hypothetical protein
MIDLAGVPILLLVSDRRFLRPHEENNIRGRPLGGEYYLFHVTFLLQTPLFMVLNG